MTKEKLMTEQQFIAKFKKSGFGLYKIKGVKKQIDELEKETNWYKKEKDRLEKSLSKCQGRNHKKTGEPCDPPNHYGPRNIA